MWREESMKEAAAKGLLGGVELTADQRSLLMGLGIVTRAARLPWRV